MSDCIDHNGERYVHESYLEIANASTKRRSERISELEAQLKEANARAAVVVNLFKGFQMLAEGKITEETFDSILKRTEADLAKAADWLAGYTEAAMLKIAERDRQLKAAREALLLAPTGDDYRLMAISLSGQALKPDMCEHIQRYEDALRKALAVLDGEVKS